MDAKVNPLSKEVLTSLNEHANRLVDEAMSNGHIVQKSLVWGVAIVIQDNDMTWRVQFSEIFSKYSNSRIEIYV